MERVLIFMEYIKGEEEYFVFFVERNINFDRHYVDYLQSERFFEENGRQHFLQNSEDALSSFYYG